MECLRDGFVNTGKALLGRDCRHQPDWYKNSAYSLKPLITSRNTLFSQWLRSQCHRDRQRYVEMRTTVTAAVRKAKNDWFQQKAKEIEGKVMKGTVCDAWKYILEIFKEEELA